MVRIEARQSGGGTSQLSSKVSSQQIRWPAWLLLDLFEESTRREGVGKENEGINSK